MTSFTISETTRRAQGLASDPRHSAFVAANAGSGKTHVLTERVLRLLLAGAVPSKILCLTYTKAAAAEMANRVFARLSAWAVMEETALAAELARFDGRRPDADRISAARRLFAEALETPGGLKIQTIHAFCEAILHQFPLEADVPGHFEVLADAESALLLAEAKRLLITGASATGEDDSRRVLPAFETALDLAGEWGLDALLSEIVARRDAIRRYLVEAGGLDPALDRLREALELLPHEDNADSLLASLWPCPHLTEAVCRSLLAAARAAAGPTDTKFATRLTALLEAPSAALRLEAFQAIVFDSKGNPRSAYKGLCTKAVAESVPDLDVRLARSAERVAESAERLATLRLYEASAAALTIADRLERDYATLKRRRGRLDFEDLIVRTADLLLRSEAADWVHYKLDKGIDHVLIDEAQDTSPRQWQVVRALIEEFFTGESARDTLRTVFAVGDEKQSIYSFQGASPAMFAQERRRIERQAEAGSLSFHRLELHQSFRSVAHVLQAVDHVFADPGNRRGLSSGDEPPVHESARAAEPGLVEVWPPVRAEQAPQDEDWLKPIDHQPETSPANRLARRIAAQIASWIGQPLTVKGVTRPLGAGDVLILVRKRSGFVEAMGAALRSACIPVAGADRLVITDHIAVQDLMALGRVVSNAEDDLSLGEVLKSPLFDFSDDDLMALALSRGDADTLYFALRRLARPGGEERLPDFVPHGERGRLRERGALAFDRLEELRRRSGFEGVFAFYARVLGPEGGRARLTARLGEDVGEVVDAFLDLALAEESAADPGLDAFLATLEATPPELKREMEHGRSEVRIMTVHASKGLEAPVVFLVDPGSAPFSHSHAARLVTWEDMPGLVPGQAPAILWRVGKDTENAVLARLKELEKARAEEEYRRLLYVGMTRAADRLVVCGTAGLRAPHEDAWLQRVQAALGPVSVEVKDEADAVIAWRFGTAPDSRETSDSAPASAAAAPTVVLDLSPLPPEPPPPRPLSPSTAGRAHEVERLDEEPSPAPGFVSPVLAGGAEPSQALRRGSVTHRLLQVLPDLPFDEREAAGRRYLDGVPELPTPVREAALTAALRVLSDPAYADVFAPGSRAEVALAGTIDFGGKPWRISGLVDRLVVTDTVVTILDYKTNRPAPSAIAEVPGAYVLQLALYRELLRPLYPEHAIVAALLFTETPVLIPVEAAAMDAALADRLNPPEPVPAPAPDEGSA
ncbi:double-strand break repair helicase AddA [Aurantimonas sp. MSK8Z-1]|uniref:double-strand break repair helicase AddA n=1 Tax=Mangrovibrevibacter kandeliae TaxID=2968473 RepID=UPI0021197E36|nr:double-strand break repair helicase AddA [Aurantimonas sp. MSK8Z-1]MCW4115127.1 double-strand break repair helicase AddA [Aurantimonas sp. MSK8Z-1]